MKLWCRLFGHDWIFPYHMLGTNNRIEPEDYDCSRCPSKRTESFLEEMERLSRKNTNTGKYILGIMYFITITVLFILAVRWVIGQMIWG